MSRSALLAATALAGALLPHALASSAAAAEIEALSRVEAVTVYPDGANVVRTVPVRIPAGSHTILLRGLAGSIDPASIRVEGEGSARLSVGGVDVRAVPGDARPTGDPALEKRIAALRTQREILLARIEAAEGKKKAIRHFAEGGVEGRAGRPSLPPDQWPAAWDAIGEGLEKTGAVIVALTQQVETLDDEITALERARPSTPPAGQPRRDVAIALESPGEAEATLRVTYRVAAARWAPVYDVRLDTGGPDRRPGLELVRRAQVSQSTGEDWTEAALTVSTVRAARGTQAPEVDDLVVSLIDPVEIARRAERAAATQRRAPVAASPSPSIAAMPAPPADAAEEKVAVAEQVAEIDANAFQASYRVAGKVSLASDGTVRTFALSSRRVEPALVVKTAPAQDETAYLEASFTHEEEAPLLAGPVSLHRDGVYVGRGRLAQVAPGEKVDLGFGADDKVKVTRLPLRRQASEPGWIGNTRNEVRAFRTTVRNLHDRPLRIVVVDRTPVSENASVTVEPLAGMTPPTEKALRDRRGVVGWSYEYKPGEQREIQHGYRIAWPADRELSYAAAPRPARR
jgi:uncharacterized protein (TIGR02231 family)